MIVILCPDCDQGQINEVGCRLEDAGYEVRKMHGDGRVIFSATGSDLTDEYGFADQLRALGYVDKVHLSAAPYKLVAARDSRSVIDVGGVRFGGDEVVLMAGPCTVESESQLFEAAEAVAQGGAAVLRGGAYKPSTSPYSFQGMGEAGLKLLRTAATRYGLKIITEVMDPRKVELVASYADILQIGTRNMQNYDLLKEVGRCSTPVLLKRGMSAKIEEWLLAAEYVASAGNEQIILCERGIRSFDTQTRNTLDLAGVVALKRLTHLPVVVDPSQGTGRRELVPAMCKAAIACGADGLLIEVHPQPAKALKDGVQSISSSEFRSLVPELAAVASAVGRRLGVSEPARA